MKRNLLVILMTAGLFFSCSSDKDEVQQDLNAIIGTWVATELKIDNSTASDDAKNGRDILNFLTAKECYVISLTFKEDLSAVSENSVNYLEISVNSSGTGLDVPCPTQKDSDAGTYTYDNKILIIVDSKSKTVTVSATIDGDILTLDAQDFDIPNFNDSGQLIFKKK